MSSHEGTALAGLVPQVELDEAEDAGRRARFPVGASIAFADLEEAGREGALDALRAAEPVSWLPELGGWLVTGHALARDVLGRRDDFTVWAQPNLVRASLGVMMLTVDGDEHTRQREPFDAPFRMRPVRDRFEAPVAARVDRLVADLAPLGACELGSAFAAPFAIGVAGDLLGLGLDDVARIRGFYDAFAGAMVYDGDPEPQRRADAARAEFSELLLRELQRVRREPDGSLTSAVANDPAQALGDDEIVAQLRVILFGAIETIESLILNTTLLLLSNPDQLALVRAAPALVAGAIEESMRLVPPVAFIERWTARPAAIGDVELGPGEFVGVSVLAANRDPALFEEPLAYRVERPNAKRHLAFSFGEHHCLGFNLTRVQGALAVAALLEHLPGLGLAAPAAPAGFAFRKPPELHVAWSA